MIDFKIIVNLCVILHVCCGESIRSQKCRLYTQKPSPRDANLDLAKESPHIVDIGYKSDQKQFKWLCQGTLISPVYILTVAQCITDTSYQSRIPDKIRLGVLTKGPIERDIEKVVRHPDYVPISFYNDIGLIKMFSKVVFTEYVSPICLPDIDVKSDRNYRVNYGYKRSVLNEKPLLNKLAINLIANDKCNTMYKNTLNRKLIDGIIDSQLCGNKPINSDSTCTEYSGASLQIDNPNIKGGLIQIGIPSFGWNCTYSHPEVFTKVYSFVDWIESVVWAPGEKE